MAQEPSNPTAPPRVVQAVGQSTAPSDRVTASGAVPIDLAPADRRLGRTVGRFVFGVAAWLLVAGLVVQVFLAGLGVFDSPERFELHRSLGFTLQVLPFAMFLGGLAAGLGRRLVGLAGLIFGLFFVQSILVSLRADAPMIAALHPLNGFAILLLSIAVARSVRPMAPRASTDGIG